jgi:predicted Zn-dependent peptidase
MDKIEVSVLPNQTRVAAVPMKQRNSVAVGIWVKVGARDENPKVSGVSHFLEHLVFKGTKKRTASQIKEAVEGVGGSLNAFTGEEYTCFLAKTSKNHFEKVFDVLADMTRFASLKEEDIRKERTVVMEEIKMTLDQPSQLVDELLQELVWPGHALGRPIAGTLESVGHLTRKDIVGYRDAFYRPNLITVVAAGAVDQKTLLRLSRAHFGSLTAHAQKTIQIFDEIQQAPRQKVFHKKTEQTHLALAFHGLPKDHADEYALDILSVILGGNMSSRLFNEVREKRGLAYDIGSFVRKFHETGAFGIEAGVDNKKVKEAVEVIFKELLKVVRGPVTPGEFERAKEFYLGQLDLGLENSMNQMLWVGESLLSLDRVRTQEEVRRRVLKVTRQDLKRVAAELFKPGRLNLALVGPSDPKHVLSFS